MTRFEKFLTGIPADAPADRAARRAIKPRLRAVEYYLARTGSNDREAIHQLRIWTRRSAAALKLFAVALPKRRRRRVERTLRKIRRVAGRVRDLDVLLARLERERQRGQFDNIVRQLKKERRRASKRLRRLRDNLIETGRLRRKFDRLLKRITWPKRHSSRVPPAFAPWCREQLAPLAAAFFRLGEADLSSDEELHAFRLAGKRLRYALELAAPAYHSPAHARLYNDLSDIQNEAGEVCDRLAAVKQLEVWLAGEANTTAKRRLRAHLAAEQTKLAQARRRFLRGWTAERRRKLRRRWKAIGGASS